MTKSALPPQNVQDLRSRILSDFEDLSKRLQQIARYVLDEPNDMALETLAVIASRCGVQPSAIVRFAKTFGFDGATQMQRLFRDELFSANASLGYSDRVRQLGAAADAVGMAAPTQLLAEFVEGNVLALNNMAQSISETVLKTAIDMISAATTVYVVGFRRSFPVASYLAYSLLQAEKRAVLVDGVGGLAQQQAQAMGRDDLLIAISFQPYANETIGIVEAAQARSCPVLAISDSLVSPIAKSAAHVLQVRESEVRKFRSLAVSMCLAQTLVVNYVFAATRAAARPTTQAKRRSRT